MKIKIEITLIVGIYELMTIHKTSHIEKKDQLGTFNFPTHTYNNYLFIGMHSTVILSLKCFFTILDPHTTHLKLTSPLKLAAVR